MIQLSTILLCNISYIVVSYILNEWLNTNNIKRNPCNFKLHGFQKKN